MVTNAHIASILGNPFIFGVLGCDQSSPARPQTSSRSNRDLCAVLLDIVTDGHQPDPCRNREVGAHLRGAGHQTSERK